LKAAFVGLREKAMPDETFWDADDTTRCARSILAAQAEYRSRRQMLHAPLRRRRRSRHRLRCRFIDRDDH
jgi:hypothetical protein